MLFLILGGIIGFCIGAYKVHKYCVNSIYSVGFSVIGFLIGSIISVVVGTIITISLSNSKTFEEYKLCPLYLSDTDNEIYLSSTEVNEEFSYKYIIQSTEENYIKTEIADDIRITYITEGNVPTVKIYNKPAEVKDWYFLFGSPVFSVKSDNYYMEFFIPENAIK